MKNNKVFLFGLTGTLVIVLTYVANLTDLFGKFAAVGCLTGFGEIPVPESLREE